MSAAPVRVVYVAGPVVDYGTERRAWALREVRAWVGSLATILDPASMWDTAQAWRAAWPSLLPLVTDLVVVTAADRTVGRGVTVEVADARSAGVRVWRVSDAGRFLSAEGWQLRRVQGATLRRFARWERDAQGPSTGDRRERSVSAPATRRETADDPPARGARATTREGASMKKGANR